MARENGRMADSDAVRRAKRPSSGARSTSMICATPTLSFRIAFGDTAKRVGRFRRRCIAASAT